MNVVLDALTRTPALRFVAKALASRSSFLGYLATSRCHPPPVCASPRLAAYIKIS